MAPAAAPEAAQPLRVHIAAGTPAQRIGRKLEALGVIRSQWGWRAWLLWQQLTPGSASLQAGTYRLSPAQPLPAVAERIQSGDVLTVSIAIPPGESIRQMAARLEAQGHFSAQAFRQAARQVPSERYPWLPPDLPHLEGFLFPQTYRFRLDELTPQRLVRAMLERFEQEALPLYRQQRDRHGLSLREWVTLASIVEREAAVARERPRIAGVFLNRLRQGMPLQADPTIEYALGTRQTPDNPLTERQISTRSPYNTYRQTGLPPTPIASPGLGSLKAVLAPAQTEDLYFVARYDGTHIFSETLAAHRAAKRRVRRRQDAP
ncbi:MAG: endolytic transglycosylase MltG [Cyanobacteria bacterium QS_8_64_29]|nr:MAG: endolytic transglycosylase MltG [Cyanobacteria bacterium QS_8_64_29]